MSILLFTTVSLLVLSGLLVYLTNKHQILVSQPLAKHWRYLSYIAIAMAGISLTKVFTLSTSFFLTLMLLMVILITWPLLSLAFGKYKK